MIDTNDGFDDDGVEERAIDPSQRLSPQVARRIRQMIVSGEAPGNSALRTEHLADRFGVSATPVREALMSLSGEGLVELRPGRVVERSSRRRGTGKAARSARLGVDGVVCWTTT